jgi:acetyl esterase/lipase
MMRTLSQILSGLLLLSSVALAQDQTVYLYPGAAPGSESWDWEEGINTQNFFNTEAVYNVTRPSLTIYRPAPDKATGTAVIIAPGGGFHFLSMDNEGTKVAEWLQAKGITAFILKYRLARIEGNDPVQAFLINMSDTAKMVAATEHVVPLSIADGRAAVAHVREKAAAYGVDPDKIGLMGFSAGGTVAMGVGYDTVGPGYPDFLVSVYPYVGELAENSVPKDAAPLFVCAASDDQLGLAPESTKICEEWLAAGRSAELHMYAKGGHGFGMREQDLPVDDWIERLYAWLEWQGF